MPTKLTTRGHSRADLRGTTIVPLMTPFTASGGLDEVGVARLVEHVLAGGCEGILVAGTTGEFASMSVPMRERLFGLVMRIVNGRALVFSGIGDTSMEHSLALAAVALEAGADALVANLPSYYPLTDSMVEDYFVALAERVAAPLFIYNIPQTTRQSVPLDVIERLSRHPAIMGVKDSEPDPQRQVRLGRSFVGREDFAVFCGSVGTARVAIEAGADGYVPGVGNLLPRFVRDSLNALFEGDETERATAQRSLDEVNAVYQRGRSVTQMFAALKALLEIAGLCGRHVLPPLQAVGDEEARQLERALGDVTVKSWMQP
ncbi:dihydrodipicolinate synthase family protein [Opitutales bacterium ASA1]|uniref:dihydrodipicolinate synthase family protein n=1 Tax=Congregicoccus parvus TaxID=3081749 RepID=UPI002B311D86|nr:dihydrodipicolinate synthase family protein [Opitutales bacterium ASA1]